MDSYLIRQANVVTSAGIQTRDVRIFDGRIVEISSHLALKPDEIDIDANGKYLLPGLIDTHVHFREPGLTHKATWAAESAAAVAGGVTTVFDMPNTDPATLSPELVQEKLAIAKANAYCNYGVFLGVSASNLDLLKDYDLEDKNFVGLTDDGLYFSGAGQLLADHPSAFEQIWSQTDRIVAIHSEDSALIEKNEAIFREKFGALVPFEAHAEIRSEEACFVATKRCLDLAKQKNSRLHILHLTTFKEALLFDNTLPLAQKRQTCEVSIPHLFFSQEDYQRFGPKIKYNPAIKTKADRLGLIKALNENYIDFITTDHSPHTSEEKEQPYFASKSGGPLVQHLLQMLLSLVEAGFLSLEKVVEKACENPALFYGIKQRGFIKEGYFADLVLVDINKPYLVSKDNLHSKCGWSVFEGHTFSASIELTFVNGQIAYQDGKIVSGVRGKQVEIS
ncbi:MAG: dihydroorotase [Flavobacteriales bacterium]